MRSNHEHAFTRSKASATVETCACGKFRFTENAGPPIVAVESRTGLNPGDRVKHGRYVIQRARDYWLSQGREPYKSGAKADLDKKLAARGTVVSVRENPSAVVVNWDNGSRSDCLSYCVEKAD